MEMIIYNKLNYLKLLVIVRIGYYELSNGILSETNQVKCAVVV